MAEKDDILCSQCKNKTFKSDPGHCHECGNHTSHSAYRRCHSCSKEQKTCQACSRPAAVKKGR